MAESNRNQKIKPSIFPKLTKAPREFEQEQPTKSNPLEDQDVSDRKTNRNLRIIYAVIALLFAIASTVYWMRFVIFYYDPEKHSDAVFGIITSACTINIVAAFISITKGLFPILSKNE